MSRNGRHNHSSQSIYGDHIAFNRVKRLIGEVVDRQTQNQLVTNNPFTARASWVDGGGLEDDLDPRRSVWDECGYPNTRLMTPQRYQVLYDRDAIAATVVEAMARYSWQVSPDVFEKQSGKILTQTERDWYEVGCGLRSGGIPDHFGEDKGSPIYQVLECADGLSGISRFGLIVYGLDDGLRWSLPAAGMEEQGSEPGEQKLDKDGKPVLNEHGQPVVNISMKRQRTDNYPRYTFNIDPVQTKGRRLAYMNAFPESQVRINRWETNKRSDRLGKPVSYQVTFQDPKNPMWGTGAPNNTEQVHWTRCQHVCDTSHAYNSSIILSKPRCQQVLNNIMALSKIYHGSAEGFWKHCFPYLFLETHPQLGGDVEVDDEALKDMIEEMMNGLQKAGVTSGMAAKTVGGQVSDPTAQVAIQLEAIAIKKRMPMRILKGSERGEQNSAQDDQAWNDQIVHHQSSYLTPGIVRPCVNQLIAYGVISPPQNSRGLKCQWPDITSMSAEQKSAILIQRTQALSSYVNGGVGNVMTLMDYYVKEMGLTEEDALSRINNVMGNVDAEGDDFAEEEVPEQIEDWVPGEASEGEGEDAPVAEGEPGSEPAANAKLFTDNAWTDEARAAAAETRRSHASKSDEEHLKEHGGMIHKISKQYADRNNLEDLKQEASIGLLEASKTYDPEKGASFGTHAFYSVRARVQDAARRASGQQAKKMPNPKDLSGEAYEEATREYLKKPTAIKAQAVGDVGAETTFDPVDTVKPSELIEGIYESLKSLDSRSQDIVRQRYGLGGLEPKDFHQIAEGMGITKQRVGQIHAAALARLKGSTVLGNALKGLEDFDQYLKERESE